ncbi:MmgE/PrpD family protein [Desulfitibacter alkalitolerans]|uniref:MmgE/PrpD family protein n=1 Tax=Desulfitibacter alkalitolerans TaxID=264641 RepID=UPI00047F9A70|nr:MmgE/PrpD family protein [Desulfitibacter alkalitolerans]
MIDGNIKVSQFIYNFTYDDLPEAVIKKAKLCLLDLLGAVLGGSNTKAAGLARNFAKSIWPGTTNTIITEGRGSNCVGAAFANSFQANAIDIDDGFRPVKGHPGALVIPAALAMAEHTNKSGKELLEAIVVGYEIGTRAGIIWHDYYPLYHASGSWGAVAAAAASAKLLNLNVEQIYNALGMAEYQAPINPMMRCIDYPSMVKDGIGWGCTVGVTSALMAFQGFTGVPSLLGFQKYANHINSLGSEFNLLKVYFKPHACCRWAQPAILGTIKLMAQHSLNSDEIHKINVFTFKESARLKAVSPKNTEEAQYNIVYPIAAAVADGEVGPKQILDDNLQNPQIIDVMNKIKILHDSRFDERFPEIAESEVQIITKSGQSFLSGPVRAKGDWDYPLSEKELIEKFFWLACHAVSEQKARDIVDLIENLDEQNHINKLMSLLSQDTNQRHSLSS